MKRIAPIELSSLNNECYKRLKEMILEGELQWGARIDVGQIAASFGISKFPVIKAVERLSLENLVTIAPNRGTYVVNPTAEDVLEITEIRIMLEEYACRITYEKLGVDLVSELKRVESSHQFTEETLNKSAFREFLNYDRSFHLVFIEGTGNNRLISYYNTIRSQVEVFRTKTFILPNAKEALIEHHRLIELLEARRLEDAIAALHHHLLQVHQDTVVSMNAEIPG